MDGLLAGVDIGGTKTAACLARSPREVLDRREFPTAGPDRTLRAALEALRGMLAARGGARLLAVGIACGGPLDPRSGLILSPPNLPGWDRVPAAETFRSALGVPARLENDANAGALAEHRHGAGRGARDFVFVTFGTGLGAGLVLDGRLHRGASAMAGELGHVRLAPDGPETYGKAGCAEAFASGWALARAAAAGGRFGSAREVIQAALAGDAGARRLVEDAGAWLGRALAVVADLVNPEVIAVGGMAVPLGDLVLEPARAALAAEALPAAARACRVVPAELGAALGDAQALCLAQLALEDAP